MWKERRVQTVIVSPFPHSRNMKVNDTPHPIHLSITPSVCYSPATVLSTTVILDYRITHLIDGRTSKDIIVETRIVEAIDRSGRYRTLIHTGLIEGGYGSIEYRLIDWFQWTSSSRSTRGWPSSLRRRYGTWEVIDWWMEDTVDGRFEYSYRRSRMKRSSRANRANPFWIIRKCFFIFHRNF